MKLEDPRGSSNFNQELLSISFILVTVIHGSGVIL